jgi:hypothetical protein
VSLATTPRRISTKPNKLNQRRKIVDWIQRQKLPQQLSRSSAAGAEGVPIITGLDRVIFGTQSAAEAVQIAGFNPPRYLWYMLSGAMCDVIQFTMDVMFVTHSRREYVLGHWLFPVGVFSPYFPPLSSLWGLRWWIQKQSYTHVRWLLGYYRLVDDL